MAESLGSHWITTDATSHDEAVALISHLPVLISAALIRTVGEERNPIVRELAQALASSGFADTSRVGGGNPYLGTAMASHNALAIIKGLATYRWSLEQLEATILGENWAKLQTELERTQLLRKRFIDSSCDLIEPASEEDLSQPSTDHKP